MASNLNRIHLVVNISAIACTVPFALQLNFVDIRKWVADGDAHVQRVADLFLEDTTDESVTRVCDRAHPRAVVVELHAAAQLRVHRVARPASGVDVPWHRCPRRWRRLLGGCSGESVHVHGAHLYSRPVDHDHAGSSRSRSGISELPPPRTRALRVERGQPMLAISR